MPLALCEEYGYKVETAAGTLRKSHPKSRFCVRQIDSNTYVFNTEKPRLTANSGEIVILQVMLADKNTCIVEYVLKHEFGEV